MIFTFTIPERILHRLHILPTPIMDVFGSVLYGRSLAVAVRSGFFETLRDADREVQDIARLTGLHPSATWLLAESFVEGGYCCRRRSGYGLSAEGKKWLLKNSPHSLVHLIRYFEMLHARWGNLEASLRAGGPAKPYYSQFQDADWEAYVLGMRELARVLMPAVMRNISIPASATRLLDVGGSHGEFAIACCRRSPQLGATVMDFPAPLKWTAGFIREAALEQRVRMLPGNFLELPFPDNQNIILLFNIIHGLTEENNRVLCKRLLDALIEGGRIYILEQLTGSRGDSPLGKFLPLMVGLNLLNEIGGRAYALEDVKSWVSGAKAVNEKNLRIPGVSLIEIVK